MAKLLKTIPSIAGLACDGLSILPASRMAYLPRICDALLSYEKIVIRVDTFAMPLLLRETKVQGLAELCRAGLVGFVAPVDARISQTGGCITDDETTLTTRAADELVTNLKAIGFYTHREIQQCISLLEEFALPQPIRETAKWTAFADGLHEKWNLISTDAGVPVSMDADVGFRSGVGRTIDFWSAGIFAINYDEEMRFYLNVIEGQPGEVSLKSAIEPGKEVFAMEGVPSFSDLGWEEPDQFIKTATSDELRNLRQWVRVNISSGIDAREAYYRELQRLPSKDRWVNRLRFAIGTGITTAISTVLTQHPILGFAAGTAYGIVDLEFGDKATARIADPYHPQQWLSRLMRKSR